MKKAIAISAAIVILSGATLASLMLTTMTKNDANRWYFEVA